MDHSKKDRPTAADWTTAVATVWIAAFTIVMAVVSYFQLKEIRSGAQDTKSALNIAQQQADALTHTVTVLNGQLKAQQDQALAAQSSAAVARFSLEPDIDLITADLPKGFGIKLRNSGKGAAGGARTTAIVGDGVEISFDHAWDIGPNQTDATATPVTIYIKEQDEKSRVRVDDWDKAKGYFKRVVGKGPKTVCTFYENKDHAWYRRVTTLDFTDDLRYPARRTDPLGKKPDLKCPPR